MLAAPFLPGPRPFGLGIERVDSCSQCLPANNTFHLILKLIHVGLLSALFKAGMGKSLLVHAFLSRLVTLSVLDDAGI